MTVLTRLQRIVTGAAPGPAATIAWSGLAVGLATAVRLALDPVLGAGLWFITYYPAALLATLFLGWRAGLGVMLLSALAADYAVLPPRHVMSLQGRDLAAVIVFLLAQGIIVTASGLLRTALIRLEAAHGRERRLNAELRHRMKNTLTVVQGLVAQTARGQAEDPQAFRQALEPRLQALGEAHDILASGDWEICELPALAARALKPFATGDRIALRGPPCLLPAEACVPLVLALHELATNAVKYGALSRPEGRIDLTWRAGPGADGLIILTWTERGGPAVAAPTRRGLGSRLLVRQTGLEAVTLSFDPAGVTCEIQVRRADPPRAAAQAGPAQLPHRPRPAG